MKPIEEPLTFEKIKAAIDSLSKPKNFFGWRIQLRESSLFPFEMTYKACDIETKEEINIHSGEMIHGAIIDGKGIVSTFFMQQLKP